MVSGRGIGADAHLELDMDPADAEERRKKKHPVSATEALPSAITIFPPLG